MSRAPSALACIVLLTVAACSSTTEPVDAPLDGTTALRAVGAFSSISLVPQLAGTTVNSRFACPGGGFFGNESGPVGGTQASIFFDGCTVSDSTGRRWTFTTLPKLTITLSTVTTDSSTVTTSSAIGTFRVESNDIRGTCSLDSRLRYELLSKAPTTPRIRQSGQVCGQMIDTTYTLTFPTS